MSPATGQVPRALRVLVVDDEAAFERPFARMLRPHEARFFADPRAALAHLREDPSYDVVLCDVRMPEMMGTELHEEVAREHPELGARFVFLTGGAFSPETRDYLERTGSQQLLKPFERKTMLAAVEAAASAAAD